MCEGERVCLAKDIVYLCKRERERGREGEREGVTICKVGTLPIITDVYIYCVYTQYDIQARAQE